MPPLTNTRVGRHYSTEGGRTKTTMERIASLPRGLLPHVAVSYEREQVTVEIALGSLIGCHLSAGILASDLLVVFLTTNPSVNSSSCEDDVAFVSLAVEVDPETVEARRVDDTLVITLKAV